MSKCCTFNATFKEDRTLRASFAESDRLDARFGEAQFITTGDYNDLINKPSIETVTLQGNKTFKQLGIDELPASEIEKILYFD